MPVMVVNKSFKELFDLLVSNGIGKGEVEWLMKHPDRLIKAIRNLLVFGDQPDCQCQGHCGDGCKCNHHEI